MDNIRTLLIQKTPQVISADRPPRRQRDAFARSVERHLNSLKLRCKVKLNCGRVRRDK
jgi:hypothetical protein